MVSRLVKKSLNALTNRQTSIFQAAFFIIATTVLSDILGILKYRLLVAIFSASSDLGVFLAAFRVPDLLFQVVIAGAVSSAFIPIFSEYVLKEKKNEAFALSSSLITVLILIFTLLSVVIIFFAYPIAKLVAPGFSEDELLLMANLMRIIQLSQIFFILGTIITAMLQSFQHFAIPGIAASFYNLGIIVTLLLVGSTFGIYGAAVGVVLGAFLFFIVQLPLLMRTGYTFVANFDMRNGVSRVFHLMLPRSAALLIGQSAVTANVFFASFVSARGLVIFDLAQTLVMGPVLLFGQSIAQASFPTLSQKKDNPTEFLAILVTSCKLLLYLTIPISVLLIVLRIPVVRLIYGASRFDWDATVATGLTLAFFAISIFAQSLIYLFSRAFYALHDTKTPLYITLATVIFNIGLYLSYLYIYANTEYIVSIAPYLKSIVQSTSIVCQPYNMCRFFEFAVNYPIYFLALAFSLSNIFNVCLLTVFLNRRIRLPKRDLALAIGKIILASLVMGVALYLPMKLLDRIVYDTSRTIGLIMLTGIASFVGFSSYIFFTWLLDIREAYYIVDVLKKIGEPKKSLLQVKELISGGSNLTP